MTPEHQQAQEEEEYFLDLKSRLEQHQLDIIQKSAIIRQFIQFTEPICQSQTLPPR